MVRTSKYTMVITGLLLILIPLLAFSQIEIPLKDQIPVFLKSLNYDKNLKLKAEKKVNVAVLYAEGNEISSMTMEKVIELFKENDNIKVFKKKNQGIPIAFSTKEKLEKKVFIKKLHAFFICPGLEDKMADINEVAAYNKIITMSPSTNDIDDAKAVLGVKGIEGSYKPYINLPMSKKNNIELDFKLLNIAEVLK